MSERDKKAEGYNLKEDSGLLRDPSTINTLRVRRITVSQNIKKSPGQKKTREIK